LFYYQLYLMKGEPVRLYATMNNANKNLTENELRLCNDISLAYGNKALKSNWSWVQLNLPKRISIIDVDFDEISPEEFVEEKNNIVDEIFSNTMKAITAFENMLQEEGL